MSCNKNQLEATYAGPVVNHVFVIFILPSRSEFVKFV